MRRRIHVLAVAVATALSAGCTASEEAKPTTGAITPAPPRKPVPVPSSAPPEGQLVTAEVPPDLIEKMRADLAAHAGVSAAAAKVVRAEAVDWPNGALGCPEPGQMYTQAIVPGYRVELEYNGSTYSYHASKQPPSFKRCDKGARSVGVESH